MFTIALLRLVTLATALRDRAADDHGQTLAEYSLIITVIAVGLVLLAMMVFRDALTGAFNLGTGCLDGTC